MGSGESYSGAEEPLATVFGGSYAGGIGLLLHQSYVPGPTESVGKMWKPPQQEASAELCQLQEQRQQYQHNGSAYPGSVQATEELQVH